MVGRNYCACRGTTHAIYDTLCRLFRCRHTSWRAHTAPTLFAKRNCKQRKQTHTKHPCDSAAKCMHARIRPNRAAILRTPLRRCWRCSASSRRACRRTSRNGDPVRWFNHAALTTKCAAQFCSSVGLNLSHGDDSRRYYVYV